MNQSRREQTLARVERVMETPLTILAILTIPLLISPLWHEDIGAPGQFDFAIWLIFTGDFCLRLALSTQRRAYLRAHWTDALLVIAAPLRPLRALRIVVYAFRVRAGIGRALSMERLLVYTILIVVICACIERTVEAETFPTFPDALWWGLVTVSTVGYGDVAPTTGAGRLAAAPLLIGGIAVFGTLTAHLAATFSREERAKS